MDINLVIAATNGSWFAMRQRQETGKLNIGETAFQAVIGVEDLKWVYAADIQCSSENFRPSRAIRSTPGTTIRQTRRPVVVQGFHSTVQ